jgi:Tfp pilus assembly protein PilF
MALNGLALTRLQLGDAKGAAEAFRRSLALDADQPEVAEALRNTGRP